MILSDALVQPVSADKPCGEDLSYDPRLSALEALVRGKEATQFSEREEPDWKAVRDAALELAAVSKDLRVGVILTLALMKLEGLAGFREALGLLGEWLRRYWAGLYPLLDPEDENDPLQRVNIVSALTTKAGTFQDPFQFLFGLQEIPLCHSVKMGRFGLKDVLQAQQGTADGAATQQAALAAAFRDTPVERLKETHRLVTESLNEVMEIDRCLEETIGMNRAPDWTELLRTLKEMEKAVANYLPKAEAAKAGGEAIGAEGAEDGSRVAGAAAGGIYSRADVARVLDEICEYYRKSEPSSPVPVLLRRAKRMVEMDFMQIMQELSPAGLEQVMAVAGRVEEKNGG